MRRRVGVGLAALTAALAMTSGARAALVFNFTLDPSVQDSFGAPAASQILSDLQAVGATYSSQFTNNLTLNYLIKADPTPGSLASSATVYTDDQGIAPYSYAQVRSALIASASTPASLAAANLLPLVEPLSATGKGYILPTAEAQALGLMPSSPVLLDGTMNIGANIGGGANWNFAGSSVPGASDYNFTNAAQHELTELMGRTTQLGTSFPNTPFDLFRYTAPGVINMAPGATGVYFSTDGGATVGKAYNGPNAQGADIQDWASSGTPDPYDAYGTPGTFATESSVDFTVMNTLGYQAVSAAPGAPGPALGMGLIPAAAALAGLVMTRVRRRAVQPFTRSQRFNH
jgi:hypothetical protein